MVLLQRMYGAFRSGIVAVSLGALSWLAAESSALACSGLPSCAPVWTDFELAHDRVATDGVLVFVARQGAVGSWATAETALATLPYISLEVRSNDGETIDGAFEHHLDLELMVWRPDQPLSPDEELTVALTVDNAAISFSFRNGKCADDIEAQWTVWTASEPIAAVGATPSFQTSTAVEEIVARNELTELVCCDGAMPASDICSGKPRWSSAGFCEGTRALWQLQVAYELDWSAYSNERAANLGVRLVSAGKSTAHGGPDTPTLTMVADQTVCVTLEVVDLVTGDVVPSASHCFGNELELLGWNDSDPSEALTAACNGEPYVCELNDEGRSWDPDRCRPWTADEDVDSMDESTGPGDADDVEDSAGTGGGGGSHTHDDGAVTRRGCACQSTTGRPLGLLVLAAFLRRRMRHRRLR
jgi:MYXO-CTERM domain-containing protein